MLSFKQVLVTATIGASVAVGMASTATAGETSAHRYTIHVANSGAGGDPGYFYRGGPLNITVKDRQKPKSHGKILVRLAPKAIDRSNPVHGRLNRTITGLAPSKAGKMVIRVTLPSGKVLRRTVRVKSVHRP